MKGKSASVEFYVQTHLGDQMLMTPVLESHGGGLASVIGFLLRVTVILLDARSSMSRTIILDESFGMLSEQYIEAMAEFMKELTVKAGFQFILVTHAPEWEDYADKTYRFGIKSGATFVKEET